MRYQIPLFSLLLAVTLPAVSATKMVKGVGYGDSKEAACTAAERASESNARPAKIKGRQACECSKAIDTGKWFCTAAVTVEE